MSDALEKITNFVFKIAKIYIGFPFKEKDFTRWRTFLRFFHFSVNDIVCDLGGGTGTWSKKIAPLVKRVVIVDLEEKSGLNNYKGQLHKAKKELKGLSVDLIKADICHLPLKAESFTKLLSNQVLEHIPNLPKAFAEMSRILKIEGILVTSCPNSLFIRRYAFNLTKILQRVIPYSIKTNTFFIGDFVRLGYNGWEQKAGHIRSGCDVSELRSLGAAVGLTLVNFHFLQKKLCPLIRELVDCLPFFYGVLKPIVNLAYLLDDRQQGQGMDVIVKFVKETGPHTYNSFRA